MSKFSLNEEFHLTTPLREGMIEYKIGNKSEKLKSLYIPGIGWFPVSKEVRKEACNDPRFLYLYCDEKIENGLKCLIAYHGYTSVLVLTNWGAVMPCDRLDIYCHYKNVSSEIKFYHYSIKNETNCAHLKYYVGENLPKEIITFDYFIVIDSVRIYATKDIVNYIQTNGFDDIRIKTASFGNYLYLPKDCEKADFEEYDRLQVKVNGYKVPGLVFGGIVPYYMLEDESWWDENNRRQILKCKPEVVEEIRCRKIYHQSIEDEINDLVEFFRGKGFNRSSQISHYITTHNLSKRYPNITGELEMTNGCENWIFHNGIAPDYYAEICYRLNVYDNNTESWAIGFVPNGEKDKE